jgi:hypothetical protein
MWHTISIVLWSIIGVLFVIVNIVRVTQQRKYYRTLLETVRLSEQVIELHQEALVWAVGTGQLPPTCPGHFMHLLIEAKEKADKLNGA